MLYVSTNAFGVCSVSLSRFVVAFACLFLSVGKITGVFLTWKISAEEVEENDSCKTLGLSHAVHAALLLFLKQKDITIQKSDSIVPAGSRL